MLISHILCSKKMAPKASRNTGGAGGSGGKTLPSDLIKKFKSVMSYRGGTPEMKALHDEYRLGSFEKKMEILSNFQKDSKCSWVTSFLSQEMEVEKEEEKVVSSWKTRRQIAAHYRTTASTRTTPPRSKSWKPFWRTWSVSFLKLYYSIYFV